MKIYKTLSKVPFLRKYSLKFLFIAFLGIHIPLLGVVAFVLIVDPQMFTPLEIMLILLVLTLVATGVTLWILNGLLVPLNKAKNSLIDYKLNKLKPNLPVNFSDEAGTLMKQVQETIMTTDGIISSQQDLTSLLSHDLRTPVAQMIGLTELIGEEDDPKERKQYADLIKSSGKILLDMLNDVLTMMKVGQLNVTDSATMVPLKKMVQSTIDEQSIKISAKSLNVVNNISEETILKVDEGMFKHVFTNLLSNAIKFSDANKDITFSDEEVDGTLKIIINDQGIGLPENKQEQIFDRFTSFGREGTSQEQSTGIGLYLTKQIVAKHGGMITASSEGENLGSKFVITLAKAVVMQVA